MRLILLSLLTFVLVGCGEIRLEIGEDDFGYYEVGTYEWIPSPDNLLRDFPQAYLVNTRTGNVYDCVQNIADSEFVCEFVASASDYEVAR